MNVLLLTIGAVYWQLLPVVANDNGFPQQGEVPIIDVDNMLSDPDLASRGYRYQGAGFGYRHLGAPMVCKEI